MSSQLVVHENDVTKWFYRLDATNNKSPRLRLLCFPYAGGSANAFYTWSKQLPPEVEVWALQLPARGPRYKEPTVDSIGKLAGYIIRFNASF